MARPNSQAAGRASPGEGRLKWTPRERLIRAYAKAEVSWSELQDRGFRDYLEVLAGLGELGLRPPIAEMSGPNIEARKRGLEMLREQLRQAPTMTKSKVIHSDPEIMSGTPVFLGTRVPIGVLFENLADGSTLDQILEDWPTLRREQLVGALSEAMEALTKAVSPESPA